MVLFSVRTIDTVVRLLENSMVENFFRRVIYIREMALLYEDITDGVMIYCEIAPNRGVNECYIFQGLSHQLCRNFAIPRDLNPLKCCSHTIPLVI